MWICINCNKYYKSTRCFEGTNETNWGYSEQWKLISTHNLIQLRNKFISLDVRSTINKLYEMWIRRTFTFINKNISWKIFGRIIWSNSKKYQQIHYQICDLIFCFEFCHWYFRENSHICRYERNEKKKKTQQKSAIQRYSWLVLWYHSNLTNILYWKYNYRF